MSGQRLKPTDSTDLGCLAIVLIGSGLFAGALDGLVLIWLLGWFVQIEPTHYATGGIVGGVIGALIGLTLTLIIARVAN